MAKSLIEFVDEFPRRRVLLIGDAILDHYIIGRVSRTSPEAPVPILNVEHDQWLPGGAANVARNLAAQGARVTFVAVCGKDESGDRLLELLKQEPNIRLKFQRDATRPTTLKTRCVAQGQQMMRVDREIPGPPDPAMEKKILASIERALGQVDGIILSDYGKGLLTPDNIRAIAAMAAEKGLEIIVDPKGNDYRRYEGVTLITPNKKEAQEASGVTIRDEATCAEAARVLQSRIKGKAICITLGSGGVAIFPKRGNPTMMAARAREVYDVTGAGDTFLAMLALSRFSGSTFPQAAEIGNVAAGIVVGRSGVATISHAELRREFAGERGNEKFVGEQELLEIRRSYERAGRRVVFTNGCFDILNIHHIRLFEQARALGDVLIVALNSDESVRKLKGEPRPLLSASERVDLISSLPYVDYVVVFDGDTPCELLKTLKPNFLVKGDITPNVVGREIVESYGGKVLLLDTGLGPSTDDVIQRAASGGAASRKTAAPKKMKGPQ